MDAEYPRHDEQVTEDADSSATVGAVDDEQPSSGSSEDASEDGDSSATVSGDDTTRGP